MSNKIKDNFNDIVENFKIELEGGKNPFYSQKQIGTKEYRGFNQFHLGHIANKMGYSQNEWFTFKQISELGGKVITGEKSTPVFMYAKSFHVTFVDESTKWIQASTRDKALEEAQKIKNVAKIKEQFVLKSWLVFNRQQTTLEQKVPIQLQQIQQIKEHYNLDGVNDFEALQKVIFDQLGEIEFLEKQAVKVIGASFLLCSLCLPEEPVAPDLIEIIVNRLNQSPNIIWKWAKMATEVVEKSIERGKQCVA